MNKDQLRALIRDVLLDVELYSKEAEELLMLTAAVESGMGQYIRQVGGPARGIFQMEPDTERDILENYLNYRPELAFKVYRYMAAKNNNLEWNLAYQIIMARLHYLRVSEAIPSKPNELASYWKKYYNTEKGKGTIAKAISAYSTFVV